MSDKITLDVGGTTFVTSKGTLSSGSTYFASLFSKEWNRENDNKRQKVEPQQSYFLDQNPETFAVLLEYLRVGCIDVRELQNAKVLIMAEFLGIETLLQAVKLKTYLNMHANFAGSDDEALDAFNAEIGVNIRQAIVKGVLPKYLTEQKNPQEFEEYAVLQVLPTISSVDSVTIISKETRGLQDRFSCSFLQALNWLHFHGYTSMNEGMDWNYIDGDQLTFSRKKAPGRPESELLDAIIGIHREEHTPPKKMLALLITDCSRSDTRVFYGVHNDEDIANQGGRDVVGIGFQNSRWGVGKYVRSQEVLAWIEARGFTCREKELELRFKSHFDELLERAYLSETDPQYRQLQVYSKRL